MTNVSGWKASYTVSVDTGTGSGTLRLDVPLSATITDDFGNPARKAALYQRRSLDARQGCAHAPLQPAPPPQPDQCSKRGLCRHVLRSRDWSERRLFQPVNHRLDRLRSATVASGSGVIYTVSVNTGAGSGLLRAGPPPHCHNYRPGGEPARGSALHQRRNLHARQGCAHAPLQPAPRPNPTNAASVDFVLDVLRSRDWSERRLFQPINHRLDRLRLRDRRERLWSDLHGQREYRRGQRLASGWTSPSLPQLPTRRGTRWQAYPSPAAKPIRSTGLPPRSSPACASTPARNRHAAVVDFLVTFSEAVTGVDSSDFSLFTTGSISSASVTAGGAGLGRERDGQRHRHGQRRGSLTERR